MGKYQPLRTFLERQSMSEVPMTFEQIEKVIGAPLPEKSKSHRPWWSNNPNNNVMTREWLAAGFKTERVDVESQKLVFRKTIVAPTSHFSEAPTRQYETEDMASKNKPAHGKHPIFGCMKGTLTILPDVDLTEPADPDWGKVYED